MERNKVNVKILFIQRTYVIIIPSCPKFGIYTK